MEAFSALLIFCAENLPVTDESPSPLDVFLVLTKANRWMNRRVADDLRRHDAHCNVIVMLSAISFVPELI